MEKEKKQFRIAAILYGILGALLIEVPVVGIYLIICAVYFYAQTYEEDSLMYKNRIWNYILSSIGFINIPGLILIIVAQEEIDRKQKELKAKNDPPGVIYKKDKEMRKIDILIKLGVGMIFAAGLLFVTTSWNFINNYVKAIILVFFGIFFIALSLYSEQKLKLYRSSFMYWLLGVSLLFLTIIGILYFGLFGKYVTYMGAGSALAYAITFLTGAGFALTTYYKFPKKVLLYTCYGLMVTSVFAIFSFINFSKMSAVIVLSMVFLFITLLGKEKTPLTTFSKIFTYIVSTLIIIFSSHKGYENAIACAINAIHFTIGMNRTKDDDNLVSAIMINALILIGTLSLGAELGIYSYVIATALLSLLAIGMNRSLTNTKWLKITNYIFYLLAYIVLVCCQIEEENLLPCLITATLPIIVNTLSKYGIGQEKSIIANYVQPFLIFLWIDIFLTFLSISDTYEIAIVVLAYSIMHFIAKTKLDKNILFGYIGVFLLIGILIPVPLKEAYACLLVILECLYLFATSYLEEESTSRNVKMMMSYLLLLTSIHIPFVEYNILGINRLYPGLIFIAFTFVTALLIKNKWLERFSYFYIVFPLCTLIDTTTWNLEIKSILGSFTGLYVTFLINKFFIKDSIIKNIIAITGIVLCCLYPLFEPGIYSGIYTGIIGLLIILIGYKKEDYYPIFVTGIILTIINIIYRLREFWKILPFWLYLLVGGLAIIGFVTIREIKKQKEKTKDNE